MSPAVNAEYGFEAEKKHPNAKYKGLTKSRRRKRKRERERERERDGERDSNKETE